jgi:hypothetical protein
MTQLKDYINYRNEVGMRTNYGMANGPSEVSRAKKKTWGKSSMAKQAQANAKRASKNQRVRRGSTKLGKGKTS